MADSESTDQAVAPVAYGAEKPPTPAEHRVLLERQIARLEWRIRWWQSCWGDAHAELDRLGAPDRREWSEDERESLDGRIRRLACGTTERDAQPVLLQEWAPEVWSGERLVPRARSESA